MKNIQHITTSVNFIGLIVLVIWFLFFQDKGTNTVYKEKTIIYDSTQRTIPVTQIPAGVSIFTVPVNLPANFNYDSLVRLFFAAYTYSQTIQDSCLRANIFDSISQNKIVGRKFYYNWLKPVQTTISSTIVPEPKMQLFGGGFLDYSQQKLEFGPSISLKTKKNAVIGYEFGVINRGHRVKIQKAIKW